MLCSLKMQNDVQTVCLCIIVFAVVIAHFLPPVNCGMPNRPMNGSVEPPQSALGGSVIEFGCDPGFIPSERMMATCTLNGTWSPDPGTLMCNGERTASKFVELHIHVRMHIEYVKLPCTLVEWGYRAYLVYGFPNIYMWELGFKNQIVLVIPYDTICFLCFPASTINCSDPTLANGVTVRPYNTTAVGSVIFYDCQPGFLPSNMSSMCGEDEMWSPDPFQVTCKMVTPTTGRLVFESASVLVQATWS